MRLFVLVESRWSQHALNSILQLLCFLPSSVKARPRHTSTYLGSRVPVNQSLNMQSSKYLSPECLDILSGDTLTSARPLNRDSSLTLERAQSLFMRPEPLGSSILRPPISNSVRLGQGEIAPEQPELSCQLG